MNVNPETGQPFVDQRSWWQRNWKWVTGVGCAIPTLCCIGTMGLAAAGVFGAVKSFKDNSVYVDVQKRLLNSPQAQEVLGKPITTEGFPQINIQAGPRETRVGLELPAKGPKGTARVIVDATERDKVITYSRFELVTPQGEHVELRDKSELPEAPPEQVDPSNPSPHDPPMPDNPEDE